VQLVSAGLASLVNKPTLDEVMSFATYAVMSI